MKKILFQVATEFHYMVALSIIEKFYNDSQFEIHFVICNNSHSKNRLENIKLDESYKHHFLKYDVNKNEVYDDVLNFVDLVKQNEFHSFISFLFHDSLFIYLSYYFSNKSTTTYLAPDGLAAYAKFTKSTLRSRVLYTLGIYKFFSRHKLSFPKVFLVNWNFGRNGYYDAIYAFSKTLPYITGKKIIEIDYTLSDESQSRLKKVFNIDFSEYPTDDNTILLIGHRHKTEDYDKNLLNILAEVFPDYNVIYKKHPNQQEDINFDSDLKIFKSTDIFPVELLIASMKGGVIISPYTTAMLYHNTECRYFWTYPILTKSNILKKPVERYNPKEYINVVSDFEELKSQLLTLTNADTHD